MKTRTKCWFTTTVLVLFILYRSRLTPPDKEPVENQAVRNTSEIYELTEAELEKIEERFSRRRNKLRFECRARGHEVPDFSNTNDKLYWQLNQIFHDTGMKMSGCIPPKTGSTSWNHMWWGTSDFQGFPLLLLSGIKLCSRSLRFFSITRKRYKRYICQTSQNFAAWAVHIDDTTSDWAATFWLEQYTVLQKLSWSVARRARF